ncbi:hypothetical protein [Parabacteroides timonensis]|uniref:hypothetical protein n=1 Tax=Parabacteroides timonensis TaxID=1871013 RepID=UPI000AD2D9A5|nr:hypothetical protein [Parabacteroides timonensis]
MNSLTCKSLCFRGCFIPLFFLLFFSFPSILWAQDVKFELNEKGQLSFLCFPSYGMDTVAFNQGQFAGPSLLLDGEILPLNKTDNAMLFVGSQKGVSYSLKYSVENGCMRVSVSCKNISKADMENVHLAMHIGIDNCMRSYPEWRSIYFPTLLKCEKTHFWGYFMNPNGGILTIASPDPIASYHLQYNNSPHNFASGHLIYTSTLDLLHPGPLPEENPENSGCLKKGESRSWSIYLTEVKDLSDVSSVVSRYTQAPFIQSPLYTIKNGDSFKFTFNTKGKPKVKIESPNTNKYSIGVRGLGNGQYEAEYIPKDGEGVYKLYVSDGSKVSQGWFSVRYSWSDYIKAARQASLDYRQKASSHTESWYGFLSAYLAKAYFPDSETDAKVEEMFNEVYPLMYDKETFLPTSWHDRIQNHSMMASLFVLRYKASKDPRDLFAASALADFLLSKQTPDGAYRNGKVHYTSVIYIAKSIMEVMEMEKELVATSEYWASTYQRHYASVKKAMDELVLNLDNIQTEGENTFEDCMIASSYGQLAMFALLQPEGSADRARYLKAAEYFAKGHRCLSQLLIPDSRVNGASIRFWESQYDVLTYPNFINSPHGWSAWRIYGLKYLYQLTGEERYLTDMMNALGSCVQLLNPKTGVLNWAFVSDPYVEVKYFTEDSTQKGKGIHIDKVIGRQYIPMISNWYRAPKDTWVSGYWSYDGGCCDNDVHEIFKCMGEVALTSAYFHLRDDGTFITWNCSVQKEGDVWMVSPNENTVETLYTNVRQTINSDLDVIRVSK